LGLSLGWRFGFLFLGIMAIAIALLSFALYKEPPVPAIVSSVRTGATADFAPQVTRRSVRHLLKDRGIWLTGFAGFAIGAVEFALAGHLVLYLTEALLFPVVTAGAIMALTQAGGILGKPGGGLLSDRLFNGSRRMIFMLWAIISAVVCLLLALLGANLSWALYPLLFILGMTAIGWGGIYLTMVAELAGAENTGTAVGIAGVISMVGFLIGPIVFGYLVDATRSYQLAWLSQTVFATLSAIALYFVKEGNRA
ncbi:MAG: MFS transporter, partial [Dehalococcoidia bacterium]|nr:MFS transporter [Dehalococcoidia bacterium]